MGKRGGGNLPCGMHSELIGGAVVGKWSRRRCCLPSSEALLVCYSRTCCWQDFLRFILIGCSSHKSSQSTTQRCCTRVPLLSSPGSRSVFSLRCTRRECGYRKS